MKKLIYLPLVFIFFVTCSKEEIANSEDAPTVVIISDKIESNDIIISAKGAIQKINNNANIDFIHTKPSDLFEAAYLLDIAVHNYPDNSYFVVIVEPVKESTRMVGSDINGNKFLMPDNGVASRLLFSEELENLHNITNTNLLKTTEIENISIEDFYSAAISALLENKPLSEFGPDNLTPTELEIMDAHKAENSIVGQILFVDDYGNCHTNVNEDLMNELNQNQILKINGEDYSFYVRVGTNYSSVNENQNVCFLDESLKLQIASNNNDLGQRYDISAGDIISIANDKVKIGMLMYNHSSVVSSIITGIKNEIQSLGFIEESDIQFVERDANSEASALLNLTQEILAEEVDFFISISTPATQAAVNYVPEEIPIIYTYVTNPESAGILDRRKNIAGVSDATNFYDYLAFVKKLIPNMKKAGTIYNRDESNSVYAHSQLANLVRFYNLNLTSVSIQNEDGILPGLTALEYNNVEAILVVADNTLSQGMKTLTDEANKYKMPIIGDSFQHCGDGALASISIDYDKLAVGTADLLAGIILGEDPDSKDILYYSTDVIGINTKTAEDIGFTIPNDIVNNAVYVYP